MSSSPICECGNQASKQISPLTNKRVCRRCRRKHFKNPIVKQRLSKGRKTTTKKQNSKTKPQKLKNPSYEFDTPEFREKQKSLPSRIETLRKNITPAEAHIKKLFEDAHYKVVFQKGFIAYDYYCIVDFYIPRYKVCLEIDGGYHLLPEQIEKDKRKDKYLTMVRGCTVRRLSNEQTLAITSFKELISILKLPAKLKYY